MKHLWITLLLVLATTVASAADPEQKPAPKKEPGTMEKAGNSVKSGYHKTVKTLKKHGHKAPCSQAQKSMAQCR